MSSANNTDRFILYLCCIELIFFLKISLFGISKKPESCYFYLILVRFQFSAMDIRTQLLSELSRTNVDYTIHVLGNDEERFRELIHFIITAEDPLPMRASWVVEGITFKYPEMIKPYTGQLIRNLRKFTHQGTCRNVLKILSRMDIPEKYHGILIDICFEWMSEDKRSVAEKVFAMQIIANHLKLYPELSKEFFEVINDQIPKNSPAFTSRACLVRKQLKFISG